MQKAKFPHMEWAKAHTHSPAPLELGFSGASRPHGPNYRQFVSGDPFLEAKIARKYGVPKDHVYLTAGTSLANFVTLAAFVRTGKIVGVERPRYTPLAEIPGGLGGRVVDIPRRPDGRLARLPDKAEVVVVTTPHNPTGRLLKDADWKMLATLRRCGIEFIEPEAGLTAFVRVEDGDRCMDVMAQRGVGVVTGSFFGDNRYVRIFLGADTAIFREGVARLADYLGAGRKRSRDAMDSKRGR